MVLCRRWPRSLRKDNVSAPNTPRDSHAMGTKKYLAPREEYIIIKNKKIKTILYLEKHFSTGHAHSGMSYLPWDTPTPQPIESRWLHLEFNGMHVLPSMGHPHPATNRITLVAFGVQWHARSTVTTVTCASRSI